MWRNVFPIESATLSAFEKKFHFNIQSPLREYLLEHNNGIPSPGTIPTVVRERHLVQLLDFRDPNNPKGAWATNARLRSEIGPQRIIIGTDISGNFVCLERDYQEQYIVVWSHISNNFERSLLDIPALIRAWG